MDSRGEKWANIFKELKQVDFALDYSMGFRFLITCCASNGPVEQPNDANRNQLIDFHSANATTKTDVVDPPILQRRPTPNAESTASIN